MAAAGALAVEARRWHPVAAEADPDAAPLAARVLGQDFLRWRLQAQGIRFGVC